MKINYIVVSRGSQKGATFETESYGKLNKKSALKVAKIVKKSRPDKEVRIWREVKTYEEIFGNK
jgi:hypothetical protein